MQPELVCLSPLYSQPQSDAHSPPRQPPALSPTAHPSSKLPFGEGGGGLCVPLRRGDALPTPAAPQPHTLPYNALFMRSGRLSSEMPLQSHAVPVPAVTLAMRVLSQHGTASLPAPARAMPANTPGPRELSLGANTASAKAAGQRSCPGPPGIPRDAGAGPFSLALSARFYSRSPGRAAVINPGHLPSRASTNAASLGLANKAITTREKRELIPECWRWALRCHIAPGRNSEAAGLGRL